MNPIAFYRQLRAAGVDETAACTMAESFSVSRDADLRDAYEAMMDRLSVSMRAPEQTAAVEDPADRRRRLDRERKRAVRTLSAGKADMSADCPQMSAPSADSEDQIPSPEKGPHTPKKLTPTLPSGDKSPSGDSPRAPTREAAADELDDDLLAPAGLPPRRSPPRPPVVDAEFEDVEPASPESQAQLPALFAAPAAPAAPVRKRRAAPPPLDDEAFDRFWSAYPRKVAKDRARVAFAKACGRIAGPDPPIEAILRGLQASIRFWRNKGTAAEYLPHAATWLNDSRWNDELDADSGIGPRQSEQDRRLQQMVGGAAQLADRLRRRQGGGSDHRD